MFTDLTARNFKSWRLLPRLNLASITGLFGANSSGKSAILELLLLMKQTVDSSDRSQVLDFGDDRTAVALGGFRDVIYRHLSTRLHWGLGWTLPTTLDVPHPSHPDRTLFSGDRLRLSTDLRYLSRRVRVDRMTYELDGSKFWMTRDESQPGAYALESKSKGSFRFIRTKGRAWPLPPPSKFYGFPDQVKAYYRNASFLSDFELAFEDAFKHTHYLGPLREKPERLYVWSGAQPDDVGFRGERTIEALLAARARRQLISRGQGVPRLTLEEYVAFWLSKLELISNFSVESMKQRSGAGAYEVLVRKGKTSPKVHLAEVGFGVSQVLPILVLCYYVPPGSTIILEQPELHLHPAVQSGLADVFIDAMRRRDIQIILESHSEHLLNRLQLRLAKEDLLLPEVALYFCENDGRSSQISELQLDTYGNIRNWPRNFFGDPFRESATRLEFEMQRRRETE